MYVHVLCIVQKNKIKNNNNNDLILMDDTFGPKTNLPCGPLGWTRSVLLYWHRRISRCTHPKSKSRGALLPLFIVFRFDSARARITDLPINDMFSLGNTATRYLLHQYRSVCRPMKPSLVSWSDDCFTEFQNVIYWTIYHI